jgi:hypothetical protein
LTHPIITN